MDEAVDDRSGARLSEKGNPKTVVEWPHKLMVIAVDGPAGAGKSTVARRLAAELGCLHVDSGAIYRSVTLRALYQSIDLQDRRRLEEAADSAVIEIIPDNGGGDSVVLLDGRDVTREIRSPAVGAAVSLVAMVPGVRAVVTEKLRSVASGRGVVMEGRDIGTKVLPLADVKIYLTASIQERGIRRERELRDRGFDTDRVKVEAELTERDRLDSGREMAPLCPASDAEIVDTTGKSVEQVVAGILSIIRNHARGKREAPDVLPYGPTLL